MARIMIVDDSSDQCESLSKFLEKSGHEAHGVPNGREALTQVLLQLPDVIVLDLMMPEMDGPSFLGVLRSLRSYLRIKSLPVVVLTALTDSPLINRVQELKVNSVLVKGRAGPDDVLKAIEEALARTPA